MDSKWIPLTEPPEGDECVILYDPNMADPGIPIIASNPNYARESALKNGYTHWCRVSYPMPDRKPAEVRHPGEHLRDELEARNMTTRELQNLSGIYECFIEDIIDGKENITHALAAGLSKALGTSAEYWMGLQRAWDEFKERSK